MSEGTKNFLVLVFAVACFAAAAVGLFVLDGGVE